MIKYETNSKLVKKGQIFVAIKGQTVDGHDYIEEAIKNGATTIVCNHGNYSVKTIHTDDTVGYLAKALYDDYNKYLNEMKFVGVTGTNGKTTIANLLHNALNEMGCKSAYIGTIGFYVGKKICSLRNTTPDILELYKLFLEAYEMGCKTIVMEVSSQGLANRRVEGLLFDYAIFTNLTQDHLDFHKTMNNYAIAKQALFKMLKKDGVAIIKSDDKYKDYYLLKENNNVTYGIINGDYNASNIKMTHKGTNFTLKTPNTLMKIETPLIGQYNVYNLLAVITSLNKMGYSMDDIKLLTSKLNAPDGRMDTILYGNNSIVIDYAHTPDAVTKILETMKSVSINKIYVVFGCTGDRDRLKRPIMTKIVTDIADYAIITMDDPHNEDPKQILDDMLDGLDNNNYEVIIDRGKAIRTGINLLKSNDILLILGKGHEDVIIMGNKRIPFNDKNEVLKYLESLKAKN